MVVLGIKDIVQREREKGDADRTGFCDRSAVIDIRLRFALLGRDSCPQPFMFGLAPFFLKPIRKRKQERKVRLDR